VQWSAADIGAIDVGGTARDCRYDATARQDGACASSAPRARHHHLESRRLLLLSLIVAILCGSAQCTARCAPRQPQAPLLGLWRSSYLHPSINCYDTLAAHFPAQRAACERGIGPRAGASGASASKARESGALEAQIASSTGQAVSYVMFIDHESV